MIEENIKYNNFIEWCNNNQNIRTVILTSSKTNPNAHLDVLSDYDIELYVNNINLFKKSDNWIEEFGHILIRWPLTPRPTDFNPLFITRLIQFEDGTKFDLQITSEKPKNNINFDVGYKVIIDKDNITSNLDKSNYSNFNIKEPTQEQFEEKLNDFFWDILYVGKNLWRDELFYAKFMLDSIIRFNFLQIFIEWYIGFNNNWNVSTNKLGRQFKKYLSINEWKKIENTFADASIKDNWTAMYKTIELTNYLCTKIANNLGFKYPYNLENKIINYLKKIENTKKLV